MVSVAFKNYCLFYRAPKKAVLCCQETRSCLEVSLKYKGDFKNKLIQKGKNPF